MRNAALFRDRPTPLKIATGLLVPAAFGALTGLVLGVSTPGYWALSLLALAGGVLAGFEHPDGWSGADRGLLGGTVFGTFLLLAHKCVSVNSGTRLHPALGSKARRVAAHGKRAVVRC